MIESVQSRLAAGSRVGILRLEQYYPLAPETLLAALEPYDEGTDLVWVQEEPANMGAWGFIRLHVEPMLDGRWPLSCVSRPVSASPATGSAGAHKKERAALIDEALGEVFPSTSDAQGPRDRFGVESGTPTGLHPKAQG